MRGRRVMVSYVAASPKFVYSAYGGDNQLAYFIVKLPFRQRSNLNNLKVTVGSSTT
jgi:hypothetical protein